MAAARNQTTARRRALVAAPLALIASLLGVPRAFASESAPLSDTTLELGLGLWMTNGVHSAKHNTKFLGVTGSPISRLTFDDTQTLVTLSATAWPWRRWFLRTEFGSSLTGGSGTFTDDDFILGTQPVQRWSRTTSDLHASVHYIRFGLGRRFLATRQNTLDAFAGLQFWLTRQTALGLYQVECDPANTPPGFSCGPPGTGLSSDVVTLHRSVRWVGVRVGVAANVRIAGPLSFEGQLAFMPINLVTDDDIHRLRGDLAQNPSSRISGVGVAGDLDTSLRIALPHRLRLAAGYRLWATTAVDAEKASFGSDGVTLRFPISELFTLRHGATIEFSVGF